MKKIGKKLIFVFGIIIFSLGLIASGVYIGRKVKNKILDKLLPYAGAVLEQRVINEESAVIDIADKSSQSVVTVSIKTPQRQVLQFSPFGGFTQGVQGGEQQDIGTGFIVSKDGQIVTNKHVVSAQGTYKVVTKDDKEYDVVSINKDPNNDIAILKIDLPAGSQVQPLELGNSDNLKVGQFVVAIGTALGEFRHTVTTGVVSGLGRGITAGSAYEGFVEQLDNVIQTDAAINPGNSGGPLINSAGQVIGINVAVAQGAQNIGFAIPINIVKKALSEFNQNGKFIGKAYLGVKYEMIPLSTAILNKIPQGAYVAEIVPGSPAESAGLKVDDIITKLDGKDLKNETVLSDVVADKKPGDKIEMEVYRGEETINLTATLSEFSE